ncbi:MAG: hypothetical protein ACI4QM_03010 [Alphaproteobacteria bacterium]
MTQETTTQKTTVLETFLKQREKRQNSVGMEAKRLVNLYRQLSLFGADFLDTYNNMLLAASPEVQTALSDIIGGMVVRQYLEFLKGKQKNDETPDSEDNGSYAYQQKDAYLPDADDVTPFQMPFAGAMSSAGQGVCHDQMMKIQTRFFEQALAKQSQFFAQALEKMQEKISQQLTNVAQSGMSEPEFEAFEKTQKEAIAEILTQQNQQLGDSLKHILQHTQEISSRQLEVFEKILKEATSKQRTAVQSYDVIEEVMNAREQAAALAQEELPPRTYTAQSSVFKQPEVVFEPVEAPVVESETPEKNTTETGYDDIPSDGPDVKG